MLSQEFRLKLMCVSISKMPFKEERKKQQKKQKKKSYNFFVFIEVYVNV